MKTSWIFIGLPFFVIAFCCVFFWYAFDRTMTQCDKRGAPIQITAETTETSNLVMRVFDEQEIKEALTDRIEIAGSEHDKFRAELATWLSVFGLLSILATLVVPACAYLLQQKGFDGLLDKLKAQREELKTELDGLRTNLDEQRKEAQNAQEEQQKKMADMEKKMADTDKKINDELKKKMADMDSTLGKVANDADVVSTMREDSFATQTFTKLQTLLYNFKIIWGQDKTEEKLSKGMELFAACNTEIGEAIRNGNKVQLTKSINALNGAKAYVDQPHMTFFKKHFYERLGKEHPLKYSSDRVNSVLKYQHPQYGFYKKIIELQNKSDIKNATGNKSVEEDGCLISEHHE